jgi:phosphoribosyl 1,2-cyclic phosphate phosphodiesterase
MVEPILNIYGNAAVMSRFERFVGKLGEEECPPAVTVTEIKAYETVRVGRYTVTPLPAYHAPKETPFVYLINDGEKTLLYLHDTGLPFDEVYDYLEKNSVRADMVSYDCTFVALPSGGGHMGLDSVPVVKERLKSIGVIDESTVNAVNHFSHNGMLLHDELSARAQELGFIASYDGMVVEI